MAKSKFPDKNLLINQIMITSELVWRNNITRQKLDSWLSNFKGEVFAEKYEHELALWLLVNFVYYNESEVKHLCSMLFREFIHSNLIQEEGEIPECLVQLNKKVRFHFLGRSGESGAFLLYYFRKENKLSIRSFISDLDNLDDDVEEIVYVDDVTLSTGKQSQAYKYLVEDQKKIKNRKITILTLIASSKAIDFLRSEGYHIINCITLHERDRCFSDDSNIFHSHRDHQNDCKKMMEYYGKKIYSANFPLGYNNSEYSFGFFYNTPDNTLPIFWSNNNWTPIIERYEKNYGNTEYSTLGRFL